MSNRTEICRWLFTQLLRFYPREFRVDFGDEMRAVFVQAIEASAGTGQTLGFFWRELKGLPGSLLRQHWLGIRRRGKAPMNRSKVILRTVASLDGKVLSVSCAVEEWLKFTHNPDVILLDESEFGGDDWEPPPLPPIDGDPQLLYQDFLPDKVVRRLEHQGWYTVMDSRGRQRWAFKEDRGWHLLILRTINLIPPSRTHRKRL